MTSFTVGYIVVCEWVFALLFAVSGVSAVVSAPTDMAAITYSVFAVILAAGAIRCSLFLLRRERKAWWVTNLFGLCVIGLTIWMFALSNQADPGGDGGDIGIIGIGLIVFAIPAFVLLNLPGMRKKLRRRLQTVS